MSLQDKGKERGLELLYLGEFKLGWRTTPEGVKMPADYRHLDNDVDHYACEDPYV